MSLYLPEQKLGSHSDPGSSSHKFMLKGRQTGSMHRGHSWIFRAETFETMLQWFNDIKALTEKSGEDRNAFVRRSHARSVSGGSFKSVGGSSDGVMDEDEADRVPYSAEESIRGNTVNPSGIAAGVGQSGVGAAAAYGMDNEDASSFRRRPNGGRFPSDIDVNRGLRAPLSPSSGDSSQGEIAAAGALPGSGIEQYSGGAKAPGILPTTYEEHAPTTYDTGEGLSHKMPDRADSTSYGAWIGPTATSASATVVGSAYARHEQKTRSHPPDSESSAPIPVDAITGSESSTSGHTADVSNSQGNGGSLIAVPTTMGSTSSTTKPDTVPAGFDGKMRPAMKAHQSANTISDLHIPGQYPKPAKT